MATTTTPSNENTLADGTHIGRVALRVSELDELTAFYRDIVGLSVLHRSSDRTVLGAGDAALLVLERDAAALTRHRSAAGLFHTAFRVPSRAALGDALGRIRAHWQMGGASDHGASEALYLTDPEGNGIEIYRDFPRDQWPIGDDGRVRIGTYPLDLDPLEAAATGEPGVPDGTDVGHVHLEVSSLGRFRRFYVDTVGFEVQTTVPAALFVSAGGYHHHLGANTWHRRTGPVSGRGLSWFEVVLPGQQALDAVRDRVSRGEYDGTEVDEGIAVVGPDAIEVRFRTD